jgi:hypothetical protein
MNAADQSQLMDRASELLTLIGSLDPLEQAENPPRLTEIAPLKLAHREHSYSLWRTGQHALGELQQRQIAIQGFDHLRLERSAHDGLNSVKNAVQSRKCFRNQA